MTKRVRFVPAFALLAACSPGGSSDSPGSAGTNGGAGTNGAAGTSGAAGSPGKGGATGAAGATGVAGTTGTAGTGATGKGGAGPAGAGGSAAGTTGTGGQLACPSLPTAPAAASSIITFNDNGGWCWYQDERVLVDQAKNKLVIGTVASGGSRDGNVEVTIYDIAGGTKTTSKLGNLSIDDHNAPGMIIRPDGKYMAMWAGHHFDCNSYYNIYDGSAWSATKMFDWKTQGCTWDGDSTHSITYSNPWNLSAEQKVLSGVRSVSTSPNFLVSTDDGSTWSYYGRITAQARVGYVSGYYKYWGNGTDRIDFLGTENHPRDFDNSLWHGYYQGGKLYNSAGTVVDDTAGDKTATDVTAFTKVFATGSTIKGVKLEHMWNHDIVRYSDGTIAAIGQGRVTGTGSDDPDKRFIYLRYDGTTWKATYLVKAGHKLYDTEQDYVGLGAVHPDNPNVIYVSTTIDPRDDTTTLSKHEIFQGVTCDGGATWKWAPITQGSTVDNLRPVVPKWDANHTALLWLKGSYTSAQAYKFTVVGTITAN
jgi:hypothetical protein